MLIAPVLKFEADLHCVKSSLASLFLDSSASIVNEDVNEVFIK